MYEALQRLRFQAFLVSRTEADQEDISLFIESMASSFPQDTFLSDSIESPKMQEISRTSSSLMICLVNQEHFHFGACTSKLWVIYIVKCFVIHCIINHCSNLFFNTYRCAADVY